MLIAKSNKMNSLFEVFVHTHYKEEDYTSEKRFLRQATVLFRMDFHETNISGMLSKRSNFRGIRRDRVKQTGICSRIRCEENHEIVVETIKNIE
jgi:hypothetical protein